MKLLNFSLLKKMVLLGGLLFILNLVLSIVTKKEGFYIETTVDNNSTKLAQKVQKQKEQSCSNCRETSNSKHVESNCGDVCN